MINLEEINVTELTDEKQKKINGGLPWYVGAAIAYSIFSIIEYPDAFLEGVHDTFNSSL